VASRRETEVAAAAYIAETGRGWFESLTISRQALEDAEKICWQDSFTFVCW
jgi:phosphoglycolate phosphatase